MQPNHKERRRSWQNFNDLESTSWVGETSARGFTSTSRPLGDFLPLRKLTWLDKRRKGLWIQPSYSIFFQLVRNRKGSLALCTLNMEIATKEVHHALEKSPKTLYGTRCYVPAAMRKHQHNIIIIRALMVIGIFDAPVPLFVAGYRSRIWSLKTQFWTDAIVWSNLLSKGRLSRAIKCSARRMFLMIADAWDLDGFGRNPQIRNMFLNICSVSPYINEMHSALVAFLYHHTCSRSVTPQGKSRLLQPRFPGMASVTKSSGNTGLCSWSAIASSILGKITGCCWMLSAVFIMDMVPPPLSVCASETFGCDICHWDLIKHTCMRNITKSYRTAHSDIFS